MRSRDYRKFLRLIDSLTRKRMIELDKIIDQICRKIHKESGWFLCHNGDMMLYDNFQNMYDSEFRSFDTYHLYYTASGYSITDEKPYNSYFAGLRYQETCFLEKYEEELMMLHKAINEKKRILEGFYDVKREEKQEMARQLSKKISI